MTRDLAGERFFHINRHMPYSLHPLLQVGQKIDVGAEENPFFRFFRTYVRQYPVRQADKTTIQVPALTFLRNVRDGVINTDNLSTVAFEVAEHFVTLARELIWEMVRLSEYPGAPSRQRGIWLLTDLDATAYWKSRLDCQQQGQWQVVEVVANGRAHECEASLLFGDSESLDESFRKARQYWDGRMAEEGSEPEVLFEGELEVVSVVDSASLECTPR